MDKKQEKEYKNAIALFENESWTDEESAMFYFEYLGEEFLVDRLKDSQDDNIEIFVSLVNKYKGKNRVKKEIIEIPIYFIEKNNKKIVLDTDEMIKEFEAKLREIEKNPKKFLNI